MASHYNLEECFVSVHGEMGKVLYVKLCSEISFACTQRGWQKFQRAELLHVSTFSVECWIIFLLEDCYCVINPCSKVENSIRVVHLVLMLIFDSIINFHPWQNTHSWTETWRKFPCFTRSNLKGFSIVSCAKIAWWWSSFRQHRQAAAQHMSKINWNSICFHQNISVTTFYILPKCSSLTWKSSGGVDESQKFAPAAHRKGRAQNEKLFSKDSQQCCEEVRNLEFAYVFLFNSAITTTTQRTPTEESE